MSGDDTVLTRIRDKYYDNLNYLVVIPFIIFFIALGILGVQYANTGDFIDKDITLEGGVSITVLNTDIGLETLESDAASSVPQADVRTRELQQLGQRTGVIVEANIDPDNQAELNALLNAVQTSTNQERDQLSVDTVGSSLGESFFSQTMRALWIAFLFMGTAVFLYFGPDTKTKALIVIASITTGIIIWAVSTTTGNIIAAALTLLLLAAYTKYSIPSTAVILAALSDIVVTVAVLDVLGISIGTASIAALLMLIGYSVDTDILLSTRVLREEGELKEKFMSAMRTGLTMTFTTLGAIIVTYIFGQSETLRQIMFVIMIGLIVDLIYTWFQNAGILKLYVERTQ